MDYLIYFHIVVLIIIDSMLITLWLISLNTNWFIIPVAMYLVNVKDAMGKPFYYRWSFLVNIENDTYFLN